MRESIKIDPKTKIRILKDVFKTANKKLEEKMRDEEMLKVEDDLKHN